MFATTKRSSPISEEQKRLMVEFVKSHPNLQSGKFSSSFTYKDATGLWEELSKILNSIPGANKQWKDWRKTWHDMRYRTKSKSSLIRCVMTGTGGGLPKVDELTPLETEIKSTISCISSDGLSTTESKVEIVIDKMETNEIPALPESDVSVVNVKAVEQVGTPKAGVGLKRKAAQKVDSANNLAATIANQLQSQENKKYEYYTNKLKLLERQTIANEKISAAYERMAVATEKLAGSHEKISNAVLELL